MPHRAILSTVVILIGTLAGSAAPLTSVGRNTTFQPRLTLVSPVLKPAQARILGGEQQAAFNGQKATPVWQAPPVSKLGHRAFNQPDGATVRPALIKAAGGN